MKASNNRLAKLSIDEVNKIIDMYAISCELDEQIRLTKERIAVERGFLDRLRKEKRRYSLRAIGKYIGCATNVVSCFVNKKTYKHIQRV